MGTIQISDAVYAALSTYAKQEHRSIRAQLEVTLSGHPAISTILADNAGHARRAALVAPQVNGMVSLKGLRSPLRDIARERERGELD